MTYPIHLFRIVKEESPLSPEIYMIKIGLSLETIIDAGRLDFGFICLF